MTADTQLETLTAKGLVRLATLSPELEYLFRHALVQDAAYGSLLKQERRDLHGRVGEALVVQVCDQGGWVDQVVMPSTRRPVLAQVGLWAVPGVDDLEDGCYFLLTH